MRKARLIFNRHCLSPLLRKGITATYSLRHIHRGLTLLDFKLVTSWNSESIEYTLSANQENAAKFTFAFVDKNNIQSLILDDKKTFFGENLYEAALVEFTMSGYNLKDELDLLCDGDASTLLIEYLKDEIVIIRFTVHDCVSKKELFSFDFPTKVLNVTNMYDWINLRTDIPVVDMCDKYYPNSECEDSCLVFVHGYNVIEDESRSWASTAFRRFWRLGLKSRFAAVTWNGDEGHVPMRIPTKGIVTKNYHQNVLNALNAAQGLANEVSRLHGSKKYVAAHSLGNILSSEAICHNSLKCDKYFMVNAAVPIEAYSGEHGVTVQSKNCMTPERWCSYADRLRSPHWCELFENSDMRRDLTWKSRYAKIGSVVNYFSSEDEVLANGDGGYKNVASRDFCWYNQERYKGSYLVSFSPEAGWAFGSGYMKWDVVGHNHGDPVWGPRLYDAVEAESISDASLRTCPFFRAFSDEAVCGLDGGSYLESHATYLRRLLAFGIPAESFAAGANEIPNLSSSKGNVDMGITFLKGRNLYESEDDGKWLHSIFISHPLQRTGELYKSIVKKINEEQK